MKFISLSLVGRFDYNEKQDVKQINRNNYSIFMIIIVNKNNKIRQPYIMYYIYSYF